jgi:hypothetical protein
MKYCREYGRIQVNNERVKARWNLEEPTDFDDEPLERSPVEQHGGQETEEQVHIVPLNSLYLSYEC